MSGRLQLFLSAVSNEFRDYREALRGRLARPNVTIKIQEDAIASGGPTLLKLDDYIQSCEAVVHLLGDMTGSPADAFEVEALLERHPNLPDRFPTLQQALEESIPLSYTQWEAYLAAFHRRTLLIASPTPEAKRAAEFVTAPDQQQAQQDHRKRLRQMGKHVEIHFGDGNDLGIQVLSSTLLEPLIRAGAPAKPVSLPFTSRGALFQGRDDDLEWLEQQLDTENPSHQSVATALCGLGGIGKTRLSVEYAHRHRDGFSAVLLISVAEPEMLQSGLAELTRVLRLPERDIPDLDEQVAAVLNWLEAHPGWLLILDNIDSTNTASAVREWLPRLHDGSILITGRFRTWPPEIACREVGLWTPTEAREFLLARTGGNGGRRASDDDKQLAAELAKQLGYLPLALEQAGAYICKHRLRLADYQSQWESQRERVLSWHDEQTMNYPASVAITWQTSFAELSAPARDLLHRLAWLSPQPIPESLLDVHVPDQPEEDLREALAELESYSLVMRDDSETFFSVHRLVQEISRQEQCNKKGTAPFQRAMSWLNHAFNGDPLDVRDWAALVPLAPHVEAVATHSEQFRNSGATAQLLNQAGLLFCAQAQYQRAEPLMRRVLAIGEQEFGPDNPQIIVALNNLAHLLKSTNRFSEAETLMRRALSIEEKTFGPTRPDISIRLNNLAMLLQATKRPDEAERLMRRALTIDEENFGPMHASVATDLNNLAGLLQDSERFDEAELLLRQAMSIDKQIYGAEHPSVATDMNNLAQALQDLGRMTEAEIMMRKALKILEKWLPSEHPDLAGCLNNLAQLLRHKNELKEAEPLMRKVLEIFVGISGRTGHPHPHLEAAFGNYSALLREIGQSEEEIDATLHELRAPIADRNHSGDK